MNAITDLLVFERPAVAMLEIAGPDAEDYLHRMSSTSIKELRRLSDQPAVCEARPTLFLRGDGRLVALCMIASPSKSRYVMTTHAGAKDALLEHLDRFLITEKAELKDMSDRWKCYMLVGPQLSANSATSVPNQRFLSSLSAEDELNSAHRTEYELTVDHPNEWHGSAYSEDDGSRRFTISTSPHTLPRQEIWSAADTPRESILNQAKILSGGEFRMGTSEEYESLRITAGEPAWDAELASNTIPLEAGLKHAISFNKGCFPGQEIVARIENLGHPANILVGLKSTEPMHVGAPLFSESRQVGRISSAALSLAEARPIALGYVKWDFRAPGCVLTLGDSSGIPVTVHALPFNGS
ncbi:MAG: YgfZ/GcvT domain-containing protein [Candidatus Sumerlaeaceae bacterium]